MKLPGTSNFLMKFCNKITKQIDSHMTFHYKGTNNPATSKKLVPIEIINRNQIFINLIKPLLVRNGDLTTNVKL